MPSCTCEAQRTTLKGLFSSATTGPRSFLLSPSSCRAISLSPCLGFEPGSSVWSRCPGACYVMWTITKLVLLLHRQPPSSAEVLVFAICLPKSVCFILLSVDGIQPLVYTRQVLTQEVLHSSPSLGFSSFQAPVYSKGQRSSPHWAPFHRFLLVCHHRVGDVKI